MFKDKNRISTILLIIVVIIAIPFVKKYIEENAYTDEESCKCIETGVTSVLSRYTLLIKSDKIENMYFYIKIDDSGDFVLDGLEPDALFTQRLIPYLNFVKNPKEEGKKCFKVQLEVSKTKNDTISQVQTFNIDNVIVTTDEYEIDESNLKTDFGVKWDIDA